MIKKCFILGAGLGRRMLPLTETKPKPLVPFHGKTLIDHVIARLVRAGVQEAVINVHYLADQLEQHVCNLPNINMSISDEREQLLDTGGGVKKALPLLGRAPFLIHNSDSIWLEGEKNNLRALINAFDQAEMTALLLLADVGEAIGYEGRGDFDIDDFGRIVRPLEGEASPFVFTGVSVVHPRLFEDSPGGAFSLNLLWDKAISEGKAYGMLHKGLWMHLGTVEALAQAEQQVRQSSLTL